MKIARSGLQGAQQRGKIGEPSGEHVDDRAHALDRAEDGEQLRAEKLAALAIAQVRTMRPCGAAAISDAVARRLRRNRSRRSARGCRRSVSASLR